MLTHLSLFSGIGGIDLAAEWAGFETVGQCEFADYPTKVLEKHWPNVPRWRDIRDVTLDSVGSRGIQTVDLISGGFPCQPFSVAGKRRGKEDNHYLWPEMLRVIQELRPHWVVGENVANFVNMELERTIANLEEEGYQVQSFIIPACAVGAAHERQRVFIVAFDANSGNDYTIEESTKFKQVANTGGVYRTILRAERGINTDTRGAIFATENRENFGFESRVGRVSCGVPNRMDRLKCLGNVVVPQQVYPILKAIAEIKNREGK